MSNYPDDEYVPYAESDEQTFTTLPDGSRPEDRRLDRVVQFDERSRGYNAVEDVKNKKPRSYTWRCEEFLDQGREGACVGFSLAHEVAARPVVVDVSPQLATTIYYDAQRMDPWDGGAYPGATPRYEGTSVLAGVKALQKLVDGNGLALMPEYRWAFGVKDMILAVGYKGPAVIGVNWYEGMFDTDEDGFVHVTGDIAGGHAIMVNAVKVVWKEGSAKRTVEDVDWDKSYFTMHNSWGKRWGVGGTARITVRDMDRLLREQGECVVPVLRRAKK